MAPKRMLAAHKNVPDTDAIAAAKATAMAKFDTALEVVSATIVIEDAAVAALVLADTAVADAIAVAALARARTVVARRARAGAESHSRQLYGTLNNFKWTKCEREEFERLKYIEVCHLLGRSCVYPGAERDRAAFDEFI